MPAAFTQPGARNCKIAVHCTKLEMVKNEYLLSSHSLVLWRGPPRGDAEEGDVVDDLPPPHVEHRVVRLPQEHRAHLVEPGVAQGLAVPGG